MLSSKATSYLVYLFLLPLSCAVALGFYSDILLVSGVMCLLGLAYAAFRLRRLW